MNFLANENFPFDAVEALRQDGHDVAWIRFFVNDYFSIMIRESSLQFLNLVLSQNPFDYE